MMVNSIYFEILNLNGTVVNKYMFFLRARARIFYENMCHMCHVS